VAGGADGCSVLLDLLRRVVGDGAPVGGCVGPIHRRSLVAYSGRMPGMGDPQSERGRSVAIAHAGAEEKTARSNATILQKLPLFLVVSCRVKVIRVGTPVRTRPRLVGQGLRHPADHSSSPRLGKFVGRKWRTYVRVEKIFSPILRQSMLQGPAQTHTDVGAVR
jgi:hypothetical protein